MKQQSSGSCLLISVVLVVGFLIIGPIILLALPVLLLLTGSRILSAGSTGGARGRGPYGSLFSGRAQGRASTPVLVLFAAVMKADGRIMRSELDYVRNVLLQSFGPARTQQLLLELRDLLREPLPLQEACMQVRFSFSQPQRESLMHALFDLALSDGYIDPAERLILGRIATGIGVEDRDYSRMYNAHKAQDVDYYKELGVSREATNEEVRKAFKKLALQWHPDRYSTQGEEMQKQAKERFQRISEAYDAICKQRGMK